MSGDDHIDAVVHHIQAARDFAATIVRNAPECRGRQRALEAVEDAVMRANQAVALGE